MIMAVCVLTVSILYIGERQKRRKLEKRLTEITEEISHFLQFKEIRMQETLEEGIAANLHNQVIKLQELCSYQKSEYESDKERMNQFIENMAHQMKTAVTALQIRLEGAGLYAATEREKHELMRADECLQRLSREVERILNSSLLASGKTVMHFEKTEMGSFVQGAVENVRELAKKRNVTILISEDKETEWMVDRFWMAQAFENIVKNGCEHTVEGSTVSVRIMNKQYEICIYVEDEGSGIEEGELLHIFDRFHRGKVNKAGYGIGLGMAKDIVRLHHGSLEAGNRKGGGAWFLLRIPELAGANTYNVVSNEVSET